MHVETGLAWMARHDIDARPRPLDHLVPALQSLPSDDIVRSAGWDVWDVSGRQHSVRTVCVSLLLLAQGGGSLSRCRTSPQNRIGGAAVKGGPGMSRSVAYQAADHLSEPSPL
jgi:hypothetical protein